MTAPGIPVSFRAGRMSSGGITAIKSGVCAYPRVRLSPPTAHGGVA
jgi:hypothetical protein